VTAPRVSRRALLGSAAAGTAGLGIGAVAGWSLTEDAVASETLAPVRGWYGATQPGIADRTRGFTMLASFTCVADDRAGVEQMFKDLGEEAHILCDGLSEGEL
jgi:hypothetical protein